MNALATLPLPTKAYRQNRRWIAEHYADLVAGHATGWVAVHDGRVLSTGTDLGQVADQAERAAPPEHIAYQFVDDGSGVYLM